MTKAAKFDHDAGSRAGYAWGKAMCASSLQVKDGCLPVSLHLTAIIVGIALIVLSTLPGLHLPPPGAIGMAVAGSIILVGALISWCCYKRIYNQVDKKKSEPKVDGDNKLDRAFERGKIICKQALISINSMDSMEIAIQAHNAEDRSPIYKLVLNEKANFLEETLDEHIERFIRGVKLDLQAKSHFTDLSMTVMTRKNRSYSVSHTTFDVENNNVKGAPMAAVGTWEDCITRLKDNGINTEALADLDGEGNFVDDGRTEKHILEGRRKFDEAKEESESEEAKKSEDVEQAPKEEPFKKETIETIFKHGSIYFKSLLFNKVGSLKIFVRIAHAGREKENGLLYESVLPADVVQDGRRFEQTIDEWLETVGEAVQKNYHSHVRIYFAAILKKPDAIYWVYHDACDTRNREHLQRIVNPSADAGPNKDFATVFAKTDWTLKPQLDDAGEFILPKESKVKKKEKASASETESSELQEATRGKSEKEKLFENKDLDPIDSGKKEEVKTEISESDESEAIESEEEKPFNLSDLDPIFNAASNFYRAKRSDSNKPTSMKFILEARERSDETEIIGRYEKIVDQETLSDQTDFNEEVKEWLEQAKKNLQTVCKCHADISFAVIAKYDDGFAAYHEGRNTTNDKKTAEFQTPNAQPGINKDFGYSAAFSATDLHCYCQLDENEEFILSKKAFENEKPGVEDEKSEELDADDELKLRKSLQLGGDYVSEEEKS
jgi:hypothetical protein